jgi:hypothetical protein
VPEEHLKRPFQILLRVKDLALNFDDTFSNTIQRLEFKSHGLRGKLEKLEECQKW